MKQEFKLQDPGEGVREVEILDMLVAEGDEVIEGQEVMTVESDKASIELPSPYEGTIDALCVKKGDTAVVGDVLMVVEDGAEGEAEPSHESGEDAEDSGDRDGETRAAEGGDDDAGQPREVPEETPEETPEPPEEVPEEPEEVPGRPDETPEQPKETPSEPEPAPAKGEEGAPVPASPAARKLAREQGVDLARIEPSGKDGQVVVDDVRATASQETDADAGQGGDADVHGPVERRRMSSIRAATARAMARSWQEIPHVVHEDLADITELELWRRRQGDDAPTLTPIVAKAAVIVLRDHPRFNATLDTETDELVLRQYWNINIAVATDRGLVTPVVRGVEGKSVRELSREMGELAEKAREQKLQKADLSGGTFTITNIGGLGGRGLAPLINPPQTAILGLARARAEPVVTADLGDCAAPETRMMLPLAVSFDHRVLDGADAARFTNDLAALLSDPVSVALHA